MDSRNLEYSRPRILLVDVKDDSVQFLAARGFNVCEGTFGTPYRVPKKHEYIPVLSRSELPDYSSQDIVIVDLVPPKVSSQILPLSNTGYRGIDWWANQHKGIVDPRPKAMVSVQRNSESILFRGGVFIIFANCREKRDMKWGYASEHGSFVPIGDIKYTNWDFLPVLSEDNIEVRFKYGKDITISNQDYPLSRAMAGFLKNSYYLCTVHPQEKMEKDCWSIIATNKAGDPVAVTISFSRNEQKQPGWIFIFPQIENKSAFLGSLLTDVFPKLTPHLFALNYSNR